MNLPIPSKPQLLFIDGTQLLEEGITLDTPQKDQTGVLLDKPFDKVFPPHFLAVILGKPASGKTFLLSQLLTRKDLLGNKYDRILYITPSPITGISHNKRINTNDKLDAQWIYKKLEQISKWAKNVLIVVDDLISQLPTSQKNEIQGLIYNRRHVLPQGVVSFIITSQKYTSIPTWIRVCMSVFITFTLPEIQAKKVGEQLNSGKDKKVTNYLIRTLPPHHFLIFNTQKGRCYNINFLQI